MDQAPSTTLATAEEVFHSLIWDPIAEVLKGEAETLLPILKLPIISTIFAGLFGSISKWVFGQVTLWIDLTAIQLVNKEHEAEYNKAMLELQLIARQKGITSPEFQGAKDAAKIALSRFVRISGS